MEVETQTKREPGRETVFTLDWLFKALPHTASERRLIYTEPSNENRDPERECALQELSDSADHVLQFGNPDGP